MDGHGTPARDGARRQVGGRDATLPAQGRVHDQVQARQRRTRRAALF